MSTWYHWLGFILGACVIVYIMRDFFKQKISQRQAIENLLDIESKVETSFEAAVTENQDLYVDIPVSSEKEVYEKTEQVTFSDIIAVSIIARDPKGFLGADLVSEMTDAHLYHGKFNAFHRLERLDGSGDVLFSVVSVIEPGHFDMKGIDKQNFEGITLFFRISDFTKSMDTLDLLIKTSKQLSFRLNGELVDWQHKPMNKTALESYKQQIKMIV